MSGEATIQQIIDYVKEQIGLSIDSIMIGSRALYMGFMDKPEKKKMGVREIIRKGNTKTAVIDADGDLLLEILAEDDEINLPSLKLLK